MSWAKAVVQNAWKIYLSLVLIISLILLYPIYIFVLNFDSLLEQGFRLSRFHARLILIFSGIRIKVEGSIPRDDEICYLICPNHTSYLDILMLYAAFPNYFVFLGKKELGRIPLFKLFFKKLNILVDRGSPKAAHQAMLKACDRLEEGTNVVIFPEGTISKRAPELRPFKNGAFRIAIQLQMPIVPVTFVDNYKLLEDSFRFKARSRPGLARVVIHDPIIPKEEGEEELVNLRDRCREAIASRIEHLN